MKEIINKTLVYLKAEFIIAWVLVLLLIIIYETGILDEGLFAGAVRTDFILQSVGILLVICFIPLSLRLFNLNLVKHIRELSLTDALKSYRRWSEVRLSLLFVAAIMNMSFYYITLNTTGLFCASMALLATFFCIPSRKRLLKDLDIVKEEDE